MTTTAGLENIATLLKLEHSLCQQLHQALVAEYDALKQRDHESFDEIVLKKQEYASKLDDNEKALFDVLASEGFGHSQEGLQAFMDSLTDKPDPHDIKTIWSELHPVLQECQKQNQVNGRILNLSLINVQQAVNLLKGQSGNSGMYNNSGKVDGQDDNHSIAIA